MTALALPDVRLHESWAAAVLEFGSEQIHGSGSWEVPEELRGAVTAEACRQVVDVLAERADPTLDQGPDRVVSDYFWITDGSGPAEVVGFIAVRHDLTEFLRQSGGHIGYSVRPSRRREGHAAAALELALDRLASLGVDRALLTADKDNVASQRTIERAGGVYEDSFELLRRYWIDLSGRGSAPAQP